MGGKWETVILIVITGLLILALFDIKIVKAQDLRPIIIRSDGSVEGTDKIQRNGNIYYLTGNIEFTSSTGPFLAAITIQKDQIWLDGRGFKLQNLGSYLGAGIDLAERSNVTIKNLNIIGFSDGINFRKESNELKDSSSNTIIDNTITAPTHDGFNVGIWIAGSTNNKIINNKIAGYNQFGIHVYLSNDTYLSRNVVTENKVGISLDFRCINTVLRNNQMYNNEKNFEINFYYPSGFIQDIDTSNTVNSKPIYYWIDHHNKTIPSDAGFVALGNCSEITVQNLNIENNENGIILFSTNNSTIKDNQLDNCGNAIEIRSCQNLTVSNNTICTSTHSGVRMSESSNIQITKNWIENNSFGITLSGYSGDHMGYGGSENVSILGNTFSGNDPAVDISSSTNNVISGNNFTENILGIRAVRCCENLIIGNSFIDNTGYAIYWSGAYNNTFYHNNFINNNPVGYQVSNPWYVAEINNNDWDNGSEGNYWSGHGTSEMEVDDSGILNTPFYINDLNIDRFPLVEPVDIELVMIPEFPSWIILPLLIVATLVVTIARNKLIRKG